MRNRNQDDGLSLVEILVSVVLIGVTFVATLGALRVAILGGTIHRDHANAHAWLQSASDVLYAADKQVCVQSAPDGNAAGIAAAYDVAIIGVENPEDWVDDRITVTKVEFWNAKDSDGDNVVEYSFGNVCQDPINLAMQRISLSVTSPNGKIIEQVELIK